MEIQEVEDALSLALVALVGGTRPPILAPLVHKLLHRWFHVVDADMSITRHAPEDFLVHFAHHVDLKRVLTAPHDRTTLYVLTW